MKYYWRLVVFAIIILTFFYAFQLSNSFIDAYTSSDWNKTVGTVTKSYSAPDSFSESGYSYHFSYTYTVKGMVYNSSNIRVRNDYAFNFYNDFGKEILGKNHPVGSSITVFYNPKSPSDSALITGLSLSNYLALVIILIILFSLLKSFFVYANILDVQRFDNVFDKISISYLYLIIVFPFIMGVSVFLLVGYFTFGLIFLSFDSFLIYFLLEVLTHLLEFLTVSDGFLKYSYYLMTLIFLFALTPLTLKTIYSLRV